MPHKEYRTTSPQETLALGAEIGRDIDDNALICFFGDLAAGKTTFIKGFVHGACGISIDEVTSPTFTYLHLYHGERTVYHFDLYRIPSSEEFRIMGFEDYFGAGGICCIEWSEHIVDILPTHCHEVHLFHDGENNRNIRVSL